MLSSFVRPPHHLHAGLPLRPRITLARSATFFGLLTGLLVALPTLGCAGWSIDRPDGYAEIRDPIRVEAEFSSPTGAVLVLDVHEDESLGSDLDFWSRAVEYQKVEVDGMTLAGRESITTDAGLDGVVFDFQSGTGSRALHYLVAVFVAEDDIVTAEAAGTIAQIEADRESLLTAIRSLRR